MKDRKGLMVDDCLIVQLRIQLFQLLPDVSDMPERRVKPASAPDACRVHGSLTLNKVAGNFHVTAGKALPIAGAHAYMTGFMDRTDYNFSHWIEKNIVYVT